MKYFQAVILAAGEGKRLSPLTDHMPKALLRLNGRPMIEFALSRLKAAGVLDVVIVVRRQSVGVERELGNGKHFGMHLSYIIQPVADGTADAVRLAASVITSPMFLVLPCDALFDNALLPRMMNIKSQGAIGVHRVTDTREYSVVITRGQYVLRNVDKSDRQLTDLASIGIYTFSHRIVDACNAIQKGPGGELRLPDAVNWLVDHGEAIKCIEATYWMDVGTIERYDQADSFLRQMNK